MSHETATSRLLRALLENPGSVADSRLLTSAVVPDERNPRRALLRTQRLLSRLFRAGLLRTERADGVVRWFLTSVGEERAARATAPATALGSSSVCGSGNGPESRS